MRNDIERMVFEVLASATALMEPELETAAIHNLAGTISAKALDDVSKIYKQCMGENPDNKDMTVMEKRMLYRAALQRALEILNGNP